MKLHTVREQSAHIRAMSTHNLVQNKHDEYTRTYIHNSQFKIMAGPISSSACGLDDTRALVVRANFPRTFSSLWWGCANIFCSANNDREGWLVTNYAILETLGYVNLESRPWSVVCTMQYVQCTRTTIGETIVCNVSRRYLLCLRTNPHILTKAGQRLSNYTIDAVKCRFVVEKIAVDHWRSVLFDKFRRAVHVYVSSWSNSAERFDVTNRWSRFKTCCWISTCCNWDWMLFC